MVESLFYPVNDTLAQTLQVIHSDAQILFPSNNVFAYIQEVLLKYSFTGMKCFIIGRQGIDLILASV